MQVNPSSTLFGLQDACEAQRFIATNFGFFPHEIPEDG
jgi:hypothetical protein